MPPVEENVRQFYANKNIFITGATGFLGKVLIEKLLRSCATFDKIYVLIRPKKGVDARQRLEKLLDDALFSVLQKSGSEWKEKVVAFRGDVSELNLGLADADREFLKDNVHVVFHCAASVRFDDSLKYAVLTNTRGTREVCNLVLETKRLELFVQVSTAYSNMERLYVEEKLYPAPARWREMIALCEQNDPYTIEIFNHKLLMGHSNTYVFAKALSEQVVADLCGGKVPAVIMRPAVVIGCLTEPIPGWNDNFNGPYGICIGCAKGFLHTFLSKPENKLNTIPVDVVVKAMIVIPCYREQVAKSSELEVYNLASTTSSLISFQGLNDVAIQLHDEYPFKNVLSYPFLYITNNDYVYFVLMLIYHMLPAIVIDCCLRLVGNKPFLFKLQKKINAANVVLRPFGMNNLDFVNDKLMDVMRWVDRHGDGTFVIHDKYDFRQLLADNITAARLYMLNEGPITDADRRKMFRLKIVHFAAKYLLVGSLLYLTLVKYNVLGWMLTKLIDYFDRIQV